MSGAEALVLSTLISAGSGLIRADIASGAKKRLAARQEQINRDEKVATLRERTKAQDQDTVGRRVAESQAKSLRGQQLRRSGIQQFSDAPLSTADNVLSDAGSRTA